MITDTEVAGVIAALGYKEGGPIDTYKRQVAVMLLLALETGMRAGEIEGLEWRRVFIEQSYLHLDDTKNGTARDVPLSSKAKALLGMMRGVDDERVFLVSGQTRDAIFRTARVKAGLDGFTFHDARRTAATRYSRKIDIMMLCRMFGWKNPKQAMVYYNPSASDMASRLG